MGFTAADIPDMGGKVALVTGANSGLGLEASLRMAEKGCQVIMCCRSPDKARAQVERVAKAATGAAPEVLQLDLGDLESVRACARAFLEKELPLHVLMNNAGVMHCPFGKTKDGIETQFGVNHVGHFLLTNLLLPKLKESAPSRIVNLSSSLHSDCPKAGIKFDDLSWNEGKDYDKEASYGQSKFANIVFTQELADRLAGTQVFANAVHPGFVDTNLTRHYSTNVFARFGVMLFKRLKGALPVGKGALTQLFVATHPSIESDDVRGKFFVPIAKQSPLSGPPVDMAEQQRRLWAVSEQLVGEQFAPTS